MEIVELVFQTIGSTIEEFFNVLSGGIDNVIKLFYTTGTAENPSGFTFLGVMLMIGLGIGLVWTLIKWISGLVRNVAR